MEIEDWRRAVPEDESRKRGRPHPLFPRENNSEPEGSRSKFGGISRANSTGLKRAYTDAVSCREAEVDNSVQFKRCGLSVMRKKLARAGAAVSRRENETRKVQADLLWFACTLIGNGD